MHYRNDQKLPQPLLRRQSLLATLGAAALLATLAVAGAWSSARAAPQSGAPILDIVSVDGNSLTLEFKSWVLNEIITLSYSSSKTCIPMLALPTNTQNTFSAESSDFTANYDWPASIGAGTYYLCATGSASGGPIPSQQTITVNGNGMVQATPGPGTPGATSTTGPGTPTATITPGASPGANASATGTGGSSGGQPGNGGASTSGSSSGTLAAIILLCVLVLGLLAYLVRIWLQGRRPSGGTQGP